MPVVFASGLMPPAGLPIASDLAMVSASSVNAFGFTRESERLQDGFPEEISGANR